MFFKKGTLIAVVLCMLTGLPVFAGHSIAGFRQQLPNVQEINPEDPKKKAGLLKKLSEAIKFRKNAITREQKRVQVIIEQMIAKDSTLATVQDLEQLKNELAEANKQQFEQLLELIKEIKIPETGEITDEGSGSANPNKPFKVTKELDPNDKYINDLVDRLMPILVDTKQNDEQVKARQQRLKQMRDVYAHKGAFTDTINDSTAVKYRLRLSHRAEVLVNHRYESSYKFNAYNFSSVSGLLYNTYYIDGSTGFAKNFNSWNDALIIDQAKEVGSKIYLTVGTKSSAEAARLLTTPTARRNLISKTLEMLDQRQAEGVNIDLAGLNKRLRSHLVDFIGEMASAYRASSKQYRIAITLPVYDEQQAYDIPSLDSLTDRFIINFTKKPTNYPGPLAPLTDDSDYSIQSSVSRYLNAGAPPYKFILCLSYYGTEFTLDPRTGTETFKGYVPYSAIRLNYQYAPVSYNKDQAYASIETRDAEGNLTGHIYYDNEESLEKKYDFILQNGLGGVAIWELGADEGYGELWDALAHKFLKIDTVGKETVALRPSSGGHQSLWSYLKHTMVSYYHALEHPCDPQYDDPDTTLLTIFNIVLAALSLALLVILILKIKENGEKWHWKTTLIRILIVCVNLFIITMFMWLYMDSRIPWFGAGENCLDMPFTILLLIIVTGIFLGSLIMRFLIFPALQHDEKP